MEVNTEVMAEGDWKAPPTVPSKGPLISHPHGYFLSLPQARQLQLSTDLNQPPENWLRLDSVQAAPSSSGTAGPDGAVRNEAGTTSKPGLPMPLGNSGTPSPESSKLTNDGIPSASLSLGIGGHVSEDERPLSSEVLTGSSALVPMKSGNIVDSASAMLHPSDTTEIHRTAMPEPCTLEPTLSADRIPPSLGKTLPALPGESLNAVSNEASAILEPANRFMSYDLPPASALIAEAHPDAVGKVNIIGASDVVKSLLTAPYSKSSLSLAVHRVDQTLLIDQLDIDNLPRPEASSKFGRTYPAPPTFSSSTSNPSGSTRSGPEGASGDYVQSERHEGLLGAVQEAVRAENSDFAQRVLQPMKKDSAKARGRKLFSKFMAHSVVSDGADPDANIRDVGGPASLAYSRSVMQAGMGSGDSSLNSGAGYSLVDESSSIATSSVEDTPAVVPLALSEKGRRRSYSGSRSPDAIAKWKAQHEELMSAKYDKTPSMSSPRPAAMAATRSSWLQTSPVLPNKSVANKDVTPLISKPSMSLDNEDVGPISPKEQQARAAVQCSVPLKPRPTAVGSFGMAHSSSGVSSSSTVFNMGWQWPFKRHVEWVFQDLRMLLGTNMPIFGCGKYPAVSLKLVDMAQRIDVLTGIDYWLDNLMCGVPDLVMCFHLNGVVKGYDLQKTMDLPDLAQSSFHPELISDVANNIYNFLYRTTAQEGHTYWLFKDRDEDLVRIYDLTAICFRKPGHVLADNPYTIPVAMLLYRTAKYWMTSQADHMTSLRLYDVFALLKNTVRLLQGDTTCPEVQVSALYLLSTICLNRRDTAISSGSPVLVVSDPSDRTASAASDHIDEEDLLPPGYPGFAGGDDNAAAATPGDNTDVTAANAQSELHDHHEEAVPVRPSATKTSSVNTVVESINVNFLLQNQKDSSKQVKHESPPLPQAGERIKKSIELIEELTYLSYEAQGSGRTGTSFPKVEGNKNVSPRSTFLNTVSGSASGRSPSSAGLVLLDEWQDNIAAALSKVTAGSGETVSSFCLGPAADPGTDSAAAYAGLVSNHTSTSEMGHSTSAGSVANRPGDAFVQPTTTGGKPPQDLAELLRKHNEDASGAAERAPTTGKRKAKKKKSAKRAVRKGSDAADTSSAINENSSPEAVRSKPEVEEKGNSMTQPGNAGNFPALPGSIPKQDSSTLHTSVRRSIGEEKIGHANLPEDSSSGASTEDPASTESLYIELRLDSHGAVHEGLCACHQAWYIHATQLLCNQAGLALHALASESLEASCTGRALRYLNVAYACFLVGEQLTQYLGSLGCPEMTRSESFSANIVAIMALKVRAFDELIRNQLSQDSQKRSFDFHAEEYYAQTTGDRLTSWLKQVLPNQSCFHPTVLTNDVDILSAEIVDLCACLLQAARRPGIPSSLAKTCVMFGAQSWCDFVMKEIQKAGTLISQAYAAEGKDRDACEASIAAASAILTSRELASLKTATGALEHIGEHSQASVIRLNMAQCLLLMSVVAYPRFFISMGQNLNSLPTAKVKSMYSTVLSLIDGQVELFERNATVASRSASHIPADLRELVFFNNYFVLVVKAFFMLSHVTLGFLPFGHHEVILRLLHSAGTKATASLASTTSAMGKRRYNMVMGLVHIGHAKVLLEMLGNEGIVPNRITGRKKSSTFKQMKFLESMKSASECVSLEEDPVLRGYLLDLETQFIELCVASTTMMNSNVYSLWRSLLASYATFANLLEAFVQQLRATSSVQGSEPPGLEPLVGCIGRGVLQVYFRLHVPPQQSSQSGFLLRIASVRSGILGVLQNLAHLQPECKKASDEEPNWKAVYGDALKAVGGKDFRKLDPAQPETVLRPATSLLNVLKRLTQICV